MNLSLKILLSLSIALTLSSYISKQDNNLYSIPSQSKNFHSLYGDTTYKKEQTVEAFKISEQVTFKEYKEYLAAIKKDSSEKYYLSQLPDTNIAIDKDVYNTYITSKEYDNYPVLGISWDNAMNYCKWKTIKDNGSDSIDFIYRLPRRLEWLAAYHYLKVNNKKHDFNQNYSDWLLNAYEETWSSFTKEADVDYTYDALVDDHPVLKRKRVLGNSYLYTKEKPLNLIWYGYEYEGYRQIAFRYVKVKINEAEKSVIKKWKLKS
jgi:hypothetical protein